MKRSLIVILGLTTYMLVSSAPAMASSILFTTVLAGTNEVPPNASIATGFGSVLLDDVAGTITVNESFTGLTSAATASHIHGAAAGTNGPVLFPLVGVPGATAGVVPEQVFSITAAQITQLEAGLFYMNVHSSNFPGGEIRGQLAPAVPEPASLTLLGSGFAALVARRRRRRSC
jgi:hypothetical protein